MAVGMPHRFRPLFSGLLSLALLAAMLGGCASFRSSKRLDVGPFAENTVGMIGEVQRATKPVVWTYLKKYDQLPSVQQVRQAARPAWTLMRGVALYSTQLVSIYESDLSDKRKSQELATYLDQAIRERLRSNPRATLFLTQGALDTSVTNVRASSDFLSALGAAQPVVSAALSYGNSLYDSLDVEIDQAAADIDARVEKEFAPIKEQIETLTGLQIRGTRSYGLMDRVLSLRQRRGPRHAPVDQPRERGVAPGREATHAGVAGRDRKAHPRAARDHHPAAIAPCRAVRHIQGGAAGARPAPHPGPGGLAPGSHHAHSVGALAPQPGRGRDGAGLDQHHGYRAGRGSQGQQHGDPVMLAGRRLAGGRGNE